MSFEYEQGRITAVGSDGETIAEITFPAECGIADINHVFVDGAYRGQGLAGKLVEAAARGILSDGNRIKATCPYAVSWFKKHTEYDVIFSEAPVSCSVERKNSNKE